MPDFKPIATECGGELAVADFKLVNGKLVVKTQMVGRVPVARRVCKRCGHEVVCSEMLSRCWQPRRE